MKKHAGPAAASTRPTDQDGSSHINVALHASESIVAMRVVGTEHELPLPPKNVMRVGRGAVDVRIPDVGDKPLVSREHAELTRQGTDAGTWLQVVDLGSRYGTFFKQGRERDFAVRAGERFRLADVELMVMDKSLVRLRHVLGGFLGYSNHRLIDDHLALIVENDPLLLIGARGSERGHLAQAIHETSRRRGYPFVTVPKPNADRETLRPVFKSATNGTLFVSLDNLGPRAGLGPLVSLLFDPTYNIRPILAARDLQVVCHALDASTAHFTPMTVPPVIDWRKDVPAALDAMLEELGTHHRVIELGRNRVRAMATYDWPRNRTELRETAQRIAVLLAHRMNKSAAATALGEDYETFRRALARVGAIEVQHRGE
ncbi:MAG: FHA domain-containing protein [Kofleriaceae bacterium]|nr:MAG: FHA domain-containing protein [Kofleriaceae bacterium]